MTVFIQRTIAQYSLQCNGYILTSLTCGLRPQGSNNNKKYSYSSNNKEIVI